MDQNNSDIHHRRSLRFKGYDYTHEGLYFITICTQDRKCLFGRVVNSKMKLNDAGKIANQCWLNIPNHFPDVVLHEYVVMPNHIHGIIEINGTNTVGAKNISPQNVTPDEMMSDKTGAKNIGSNTVGAKDFLPLPSRPNGTSKTIGSIVREFKIGVTKWMRQNTNIYDVWQRNYYVHIIRDEQSYHRIAEYIKNNPANWRDDEFHM